MQERTTAISGVPCFGSFRAWALISLRMLRLAHFGNTSAKDAHMSHVSCWGLRRFHDRARMPKIPWVDSK